MHSVTLGVAALWVLMALALAADLSFASLAANALSVFLVTTAGIAVLLARARSIRRRTLSVLATIVLSGVYLSGLCFLGLGLAFYPWGTPDLEVYEDGLVCRAVYHGQYAEVRVSKVYPLGLERFKESYLIDGSPSTIHCGQGRIAWTRSAT